MQWSDGVGSTRRGDTGSHAGAHLERGVWIQKPAGEPGGSSRRVAQPWGPAPEIPGPPAHWGGHDGPATETGREPFGVFPPGLGPAEPQGVLGLSRSLPLAWLLSSRGTRPWPGRETTRGAAAHWTLPTGYRGGRGDARGLWPTCRSAGGRSERPSWSRGGWGETAGRASQARPLHPREHPREHARERYAETPSSTFQQLCAVLVHVFELPVGPVRVEGPRTFDLGFRPPALLGAFPRACFCCFGSHGEHPLSLTPQAAHPVRDWSELFARHG